MSSNSLVEPVLPEYPECSGQSSLEVCSLFIGVVEFGWAGEFGHFHFGFDFGDSGLEGCDVGGLGG